MLLAGLDTILRLLHPIMPFVTEEIWQHLREVAGTRRLPWDTRPLPDSIMVAQWPVPPAPWIDPSIEDRFGTFLAVVGAIREIRARQNVPPKTRVKVAIRAPAEQADLLARDLTPTRLPQLPLDVSGRDLEDRARDAVLRGAGHAGEHLLHVERRHRTGALPHEQGRPLDALEGREALPAGQALTTATDRLAARLRARVDDVVVVLSAAGASHVPSVVGTVARTAALASVARAHGPAPRAGERRCGGEHERGRGGRRWPPPGAASASVRAPCPGMWR
jgi:hypothetical protein